MGRQRKATAWIVGAAGDGCERRGRGALAHWARAAWKAPAAVVLALACLAATGTGLRAGAAPSVAAPPRPNVVVIMTDDVPPLDGRVWASLRSVTSLFVRQGVGFADFHGESPLCCPGRAGFLTGQHTRNHGVSINDARLLDARMTLATQLHRSGYFTFLVGKYLNGYGTLAPAVPPGWDRFEAFDEPAYYDYTMWNDGSAVPEVHGTAPSDYSTDVVAAKAVALLRAAPPGQPLFAWIAPYAAHSNGHEEAGGQPLPPPRYASDPRCASIPGWAPPNYNERDVSDKPLYIRRMPLLAAPAYDLHPLCRTLLGVDDLVAAVRDELAREGRLDTTLLVFTSDNGMNAGAHRLLDKSTPYATELPLFVHWPAALGTGSRTIRDRVQNIDFAPTVCALAGCTMGPYPDGRPRPDGLNVADLLLGRGSAPGRDAVIEGLPGHSGWDAIATTAASPLARQGCASAAGAGCRWHYVEYPNGEREVYDQSGGPCWSWDGRTGDPCELQNRAADPAYATIRRLLARRLAQLEATNGGGDRTPPNPPTQVRGVALSPTEIQLSWAPSHDPSGIRRYLVTGDASQLALAVLDGRTLTFTATGLDPASTHSYRISAMDGANNSSARSTAVTITTPRS